MGRVVARSDFSGRTGGGMVPAIARARKLQSAVCVRAVKFSRDAFGVYRVNRWTAQLRSPTAKDRSSCRRTRCEIFQPSSQSAQSASEAIQVLLENKQKRSRDTLISINTFFFNREINSIVITFVQNNIFSFQRCNL